MRHHHATALLALSLAVTIPACGGSGGTDPAGAASSHATPAEVKAGDLPAPAALKDVIARIDLQKFPFMEGATRSDSSPISSFCAIPKGDVKKAIEFYRDQLGPVGWQPATDPQLWQVFDQGAMLIFTKDSHMLYASIGISPGDGNLNACLIPLGNLDARRLPRFPAAQVTSEFPQRIVYQAKATPAAIKEYLGGEMKKRGWVAWRRPWPGKPPRPANFGDTEMNFLHRSASIEGHLSAKDDQTQVNVGVRVLELELPFPADAHAVEYSQGPLSLTLRTALKPDEVVSFYEKEMGALGWKSSRPEKKKKTIADVTLLFEAVDQNPLLLQLLEDQEGSFVQITPS